MQTSLIINEIEKKYPVDKIIANGVPVWQFLRNIYADELNKIQFHQVAIKGKRGFGYLINIFSNYFWGITNMKKHFPVVLFTDTLEDRWVNGLITDKLAHNLLIKMADKILVVLDPINNKHNPISDYHHPNYLSIYNFVLPSKFRWKKIRFQNLQILKKIEIEIGVHIPYQERIKQFFHFVEVFQIWIIKTAPKIIFVNCYFSLRHQALIYAAKQNKVITAEFQHGIISKAQTAYSIGKNIGNHTFPDYLLSFGEMEKKQVSKNIISCNNIIPIGNYYLEYNIRENMNRSPKQLLSTLRKQYDKLILVSSQDLIENDLLEFLSLAAIELPNTVFIFVPRRGKRTSKWMPSIENILILPDIDIYQYCSFCDFHSTVFSTFASESVFMGIPNILININGLSKSYYSEIFSDISVVKFADDVKSYVKIISEWHPPKTEEVKTMVKQLFTSNHQRHLADFIEKEVKVI